MWERLDRELGIGIPSVLWYSDTSTPIARSAAVHATPPASVQIFNFSFSLLFYFCLWPPRSSVISGRCTTLATSSFFHSRPPAPRPTWSLTTSDKAPIFCLLLSSVLYPWYFVRTDTRKCKCERAFQNAEE